MNKILPLIILILVSCKPFEARENGSQFHIFETHDLRIAKLTEASGLAASLLHDDILYSINDSGHYPEVFLMDNEGNDRGKMVLKGIVNRDWEDITTGRGPEGDHYIFVAEIGDNLSRHDIKYIYRFKEPENLPAPESSVEITGYDSIRFRFPDGMRDAETLLFEPATSDLYIFSKREDTIGIYVARYPQSVNEIIVVEKVGKLRLKNVVAGSISPDGREVLLKTYDQILYWSKRRDQPAYEVIINRDPEYLPYEVEPQGESITWHPDQSGYFTLSEEPRGIEAKLYFYKKSK